MDLTLRTETFGDYVPFLDSAHKHLVRGGVTLDSAFCRDNRIESQGQVVLRDGRHVVLAGSVIGQDGPGGLWEVYTPEEAAVAATLDIGDPTADQAIRLTADTAGSAGNDIRIQLVDPEATSESLAVTVIGNKIEVSLETDGGDALISDADDVVAAINGDTDAGALVTAEVHPDATNGSGEMETHDLESLDGGADEISENISAANDVVLLWQDVDIQDGNAAGGALDHGRVLTDRLPFSDATSRALLISNGIKFVATS